MSGWKLFMTEKTELCRRSLRRYAGSSKCKKNYYHDASVVIDHEVKVPKEQQGGLFKDGYENNPNWPKTCACEYIFQEHDQWQVNVTPLYKGAPDGKLYVLRELPPGGVWDAEWLDFPKYRGPDGKAWCVAMPGGVEWIIYGPSSDGKPWVVTGTLPNITAHPSIGIGKHYHGFIRNGVITEDVDKRKFEGVPRTA